MFHERCIGKQLRLGGGSSKRIEGGGGENARVQNEECGVMMIERDEKSKSNWKNSEKARVVRG
jgi:hypothetical protein